MNIEKNNLDLNFKKNAYIVSKLKKPLIFIVITFSISIFGLTIIPGQDSVGNIVHLNYFDAFYFILYTATTIGYGEGDNPLTYAQKVWVVLSIIFTVISWFYAISKIVSIFQDKDFLNFLILSNQQSKINKTNKKFIIISGYSQSVKKLIDKLFKEQISIVLIENNIAYSNEITLNYSDNILINHLNIEPATKESLFIAGIENTNCIGVLGISDNTRYNLKTMINSKYIVKDKILISKNLNHKNDREFKIIGEKKSINPYKLIAEELLFLYINPSLSNIINWLHTGTLYNKNIIIEKKSLLVIGYGNLSYFIEKKLTSHLNNITYIEKDFEDVEKNILKADARFPENINKVVDISDYDMVFITTGDDYLNYIVARNIHKINSNIQLYVKINYEINEKLFVEINQNIRIFNVDKIVSDEIFYRLMNKDFLKIVSYFKKFERKKIDNFYNLLVNNFKKPQYKEIEIDEINSPALYKKIKKNIKIPLNIFKKNIANIKINSKIILLFLIRNKEVIELSSDKLSEIAININDKIFFIYDTEEGLDNIYSIMNDVLELNLILKKMKLI